MATNAAPEIVLYDLANIHNVCFSPTVWRVRLLLNYKQIPYRTVFLEFPDIEPTLKGLGIAPYAPDSGSKHAYTVPAIHHIPSNTNIMDSVPIMQFLEKTYPNPPLTLTSPFGDEVVSKSLSTLGTPFRISIMSREINILNPTSQDYFRRTREAALGFKLEDLLDGEEEAWKKVESAAPAIGELMRKNKAEGPFILGAQPSGNDFFIAGSLELARVVDEGVFERIVRYEGFRELYEGCTPWLKRNN